MPKSNAPTRRRHPPKVAPASAIGDPITIRGRLALLGWASVEAWAAAHGYERTMASYCIRTWGNRTDRQPHGGISRALMSDLRETLANNKRPTQTCAETN